MKNHEPKQDPLYDEILAFCEHDKQKVVVLFEPITVQSINQWRKKVPRYRAMQFKLWEGKTFSDVLILRLKKLAEKGLVLDDDLP